MGKSAWLISFGSLLVFWGLLLTALGTLRPQFAPTFVGFIAYLAVNSLMFSGGLTLLVTGIVRSAKE